MAVAPLMPIWRNFFLGSELTTGWGPFRRLNVKAMKEITRQELLSMGIDLRDVDQPIGTLSGVNGSPSRLLARSISVPRC